MTSIREIWSSNFEEEMMRINLSLQRFDMIAIDVEFPGFLRYTPRQACEQQVYADLKFNVDRLIPIQFGFALFDSSGNHGGVWQVNFTHFDSNININDFDASTSLSLTKRKSGIDFEKQKREGVDPCIFAVRLKEIMTAHHDIKWITFHGLYDLGYMAKIATEMLLPNSLQEFQLMIGNLFGRIYDIKYMARFCGGLHGGELGLQKLANILKVGRTGSAHQAGSDSLLTARVYLDMKQLYNFDEKVYEGFLYGVSGRVMKRDKCQFSPRLGWPLQLVPPYFGPVRLVKLSNTPSPFLQRPVVVRCVPQQFFQAPPFHPIMQHNIGL